MPINLETEVSQLKNSSPSVVESGGLCTNPTLVAKACRQAKEAFYSCGRSSTATERSEALYGVARLIRENKQEFARCEAADTGKLIETALLEVEGAIALWEYAAALARSSSSHAFSSSMRQGLAVTYSEPVGVVGLIVPWNYPLVTTSERMPFALGAGCAVVLKPSEVAVGALPLLIQIIVDSHLFPSHMVQVVYGAGESVGSQLCINSDVNMIAFVGSTKVGRLIESAATLTGKRVSAEMGGNNFVAIYADADFEAAAHAVIVGGFRNAGQACIAGTHVMVDPKIAKEFASALQRQFDLIYGSSDENIQSTISLKHQASVVDVIEAALEEGLGFLPGCCLKVAGNKLIPIIFDDVPLSSILFKNEIFGPIITVSYINQNDFIDIVNSSDYGLAAYVWTTSVTNALHVTKQLRVGRIWVNAPPDYWLPELPVGGFGASGYGRESGPNGLDTYCLTKSVIIY
ncbi:aldehyde dehydrogenase family protein [Deefgea piscis]|uniref:aldehyde dehydrogenase family protein n=1 Tax=Deefgea piscis TaxID=2739061 RepID=UPI001C7EA12F|nr:aldehyde dehydrogenase family protein [Deefgea piscis]QZA80037.1 aldehyde dehydrogenase family protein [Deefgea piscis]